MEVEPRRAVVTPRACAAPDGEPLPLHDHVGRLLSRRVTGLVNLFGGPGSGKTTALRHLAAVLPPDEGLVLLDEHDNVPAILVRSVRTRLVLLATRRRTDDLPHLAAFRMAPWSIDDAIEYLLAKSPARCPSVMARVKEAPALATTGGVPELWRVVLDEMIASDATASPAEALRHFLASRLGDARFRDRVTDYCLHELFGSAAGPNHFSIDPRTWFGTSDPALVRLLYHVPVRLLLAAQRIVWDLADGNGCAHLHRRLPGELLREVAALASFREPVMSQLRWIVRDRCDPGARPTAASILHATGTGWRPEGPKPDLCGARLEGAKWAGIDLSQADLSAARLADSNLDGAKLDGATVASGDFTEASLRAASLRTLRAMNAVFAGADLSAAVAPGADFRAADLRRADLTAADLHGAHFVGSDLSSAKLRRADLRGVTLQGSNLDGADLSGADLTVACVTDVNFHGATLVGALFDQARLLNCDLRVMLPKAVFREAVLSRCDLGGSFLPAANFWGATLHSCGLGGVHWERANLRNVDFTGSSFHTGSSRSGLVGSTVASEGTRTGFYTDDYDDRTFKPPEEIRKANLRGADLRGAKVDATDFYLVDLRGARYTRRQADHFKRCGAIL